MNKVILILVILATQSCLGGGSDYYRDRVEPFLKELKPNYKSQVFDGVMEPAEFPDLDEDQKTLIGIDSNHDGVRDDMEIFINRNFNTWIERDNLKNELRRAPQFFRNYKNMTLDEFIVYESNDFLDMDCIYYGLKYLKLARSQELSIYRSAEAVYNTKERSLAISHFSQQLAGRAYGDGYGDKSIFQSCKKKIDELINRSNGER